ncbi:MAG: MBL fold metallo-hydrolase [Planctomycetes bacterium]|nr:MBL fold metallo-hydrolase [Planctomycetota bacterium]
MDPYDVRFAREIYSGIYRLGIEKARTNIYLLDCGDEYVMMDTGPTGSLDGIRGQITALGIQPEQVSYIIVSHCNCEVIGTLAAMKRRTGAKVIAHGNAAVPIERGDVIRTGASMVPYEGFFASCPVDVKVGDEHVLRVGSREIVIQHFHSYSAGSLGIEFKGEEGTFVMLGAAIFKDGGMGFLDFHFGSNIPKYIENLQKLKERYPDYILPSHGMWFRFSKRIINKALKRLKFYEKQPEFGLAGPGPMTDSGYEYPKE